MMTEYDDRIDKLYDKDFKPIDFDYKKYARIVDRINNKDPHSTELRNMISRDNFKHIPNGVYYFAVDNKVLVPHVLFRKFDILVIGYLVNSDLEKDKYSYYMIFTPISGNYVWYGKHHGTIAFHDNYYYGFGTTTEMARDNLELNMFDKFRSQFLSIASKGKEKVK